ncbi:MAG: hypothetical protein Q8R31_00830 [Candidatus Omnitrophota bacterium]|nr:hypothetical protein [Candidatus Omnitrophota bacterium]
MGLRAKELSDKLIELLKETEVKVQIGKKGIHGFIKIGDESWGYGDKGISYPNEKLYGGPEGTTYEDTNADPFTVINNIQNMTKSGEWKGGWKKKNKGGDYWPSSHDCWDFIDSALGGQY